MCGRYSNSRTNPQAIAARFEIKISDATAEAALGRTNIAPTQSVLAVVNRENGEREAILARFGLAPAWAKLRGGPSLINTRDDKLASSGVRLFWSERERPWLRAIRVHESRVRARIGRSGTVR
jgi:putative SOS response-associated peptidase YedK